MADESGVQQGRGGPGLGDSGEAAAGLKPRQRRAAVCWELGQWWHMQQRKLRARKGRSAAAGLRARKGRSAAAGLRARELRGRSERECRGGGGGGGCVENAFI